MQRERKYIMDELKYLKAVIKNNIFDENGSLKYNYKFSTYSSLYASTTEIIKGYLDKIELEGLSILAPAASGDHALECLSKKAKLVETFDINSYAFHMQNLKFAAVKNLSRNEFICFFINMMKNYMNLMKDLVLKYIKELDMIYQMNQNFFGIKFIYI